MFVTGKCLCGAVRYQCAEPPMMSGLCHCEDCQRQTGSSFAPLLIFRKDGVSFEGEALREYLDQGDSGKEVKRGFCAECGSSLYAWYEVTPDFMVMMAGTINDTNKFIPEWDIYTESAQGWVSFPPGHKVFPRGFGSS